MTADDRITVPDTPEAMPAVCPVSGLSIRSHPEWVYTHPDRTYRTSIALIGDAIFWVIPRGYVTEASMAAATALAADILAQVQAQCRPFVFIENFAYTRGGTVGARRRYLRFTNTLEGLLGSFPYGMPPFFRLSFNFSRRLHLHRYRVQMMASYADAVAAALAMLERNGLDPGTPPQRSTGNGRRPHPDKTAVPSGARPAPDAEKGHALAPHVDALLAYLGCLDLESPGVPAPAGSAGADPSLRPVYEALAMLKLDMDLFLSEHLALMADLQERQHQLVTQAHAIEQRNRELQALLEQSAGDQAALGAQVRQNVETLLKPVLRLVQRDRHQSTAPGYPEQLESDIDAFVQDLFPRRDLRHYRLTPREIRIARLIRGGQTSRGIARRLGISVSTVTTFRRSLRAKLGIRGRKRNLRTVLKALPDEGDRLGAPEM